MELFVSFSEIIQYFKRNIRKFVVIVALFGIVFALLPLRFVQHEYSASTTIVISCEIPEDATTDYRLQYTGILSSRVQTAVAMADGSDLIAQTAEKLGIDEAQITSIGAVQLNAAPVVKLSASSANAELVSKISDTAAQVLAEKLTAAFPSPALTADVTDKAIPAVTQSNKSAMLKAGFLGLIIGFILCVCFGIAVVLMDKTIRNSSYVSEALRTNLLAILSKKGSEEKKLNSFRKLRAAAINQAGDGKSFMVADVCEHNGAPCVSVGFAKALACSEKTVLLIDADLRMHHIAKMLEVNPVKTLSDVLTGECPAEQAVSSTSLKGLSIMAGSESSVEDFTDVLASDKFEKLVQELAPRFDYVIVNVPSEVRYPDADNLAKLFSAVVMVVKYGSTPYHEFKDAFYRLKTSGANIIGFVTTNS